MIATIPAINGADPMPPEPTPYDFDWHGGDEDVRRMVRVASGDQVAFAELVERHGASVGRMLRRMVGDLHQTEDLTQEVFLRIYRARRSYRPRARFSTWLFTIARNVARNRLRYLARRKLVWARQLDHTSTSLNELLADSSADPAAGMEREEEVRLLREGIERLGSRQQTALKLFTFQRLSYQEIADHLGVSRKAIKSLLARARENLQDQLSELLPADGAGPAASAEPTNGWRP